MLGKVYPSTGENRNFIFRFFQNCELRSNFQHRQYAPARGSCQNFACGKFCNSKKIRSKNFIFFLQIFSKMVWIFFVPSGLFYRGFMALQNGWKNLEISLKLFHHRLPNVFSEVSLKVQSFYYWAVRRSVEGRWPHTCITFKKFPFIRYRKLGPNAIRFFWNIWITAWNFSVLSSKFYRGKLDILALHSTHYLS